MKMLAKNSGFTLIELLIVVLIVGILAQLAIPVYRESSDRAKYSEVEIQMATMNKALRAFYAQYGGYPPDVYPGEPPPGLVPEFLDKWPTPEDDVFGSEYDYEAWRMGDGYWIGISYFGKNKIRDTGAHSNSWFVQNGVDGVPMKKKDDMVMQIAAEGQVVEEGLNFDRYRKIGTATYRYEGN